MDGGGGGEGEGGGEDANGTSDDGEQQLDRLPILEMITYSRWWRVKKKKIGRAHV